MDNLMEDFLGRLTEVTKGCRPDMHEPDEQGVDAIVIGNQFDNASGDKPYFPMRSGTVYPYSEITVCIFREDTIQYEWFNLATLIAVARLVPALKAEIEDLELDLAETRRQRDEK